MGRCYTRRPYIYYSLRYRDGGDVAGCALAVLPGAFVMHACLSLVGNDCEFFVRFRIRCSRSIKVPVGFAFSSFA